MHLLRNPFFLLAFSLYLVNRYLLAVLGLVTYKVPYLNDLLCLPVVLTVTLWLQQKLFPRNFRHRLNVAQVVFAVIYFAVFFEGILPGWSNRYTRDYLDVLAYALGGVIYYFVLNPRPKPQVNWNEVNNLSLPSDKILSVTPVISIREATVADNTLLADLGWKTFEQAFAAANTPEDMAAYLPKVFSPPLQAAELADPLNIFWLIFTGEECIGYVKMFTGPAEACLTNAKALKISRLYLSQNWYGHGIGSELLHRCLQYAHEKEYASVWLTVWEHNTRALALYQKLGFRIVGDEGFVLGQDVQHDYIMEKVL